jgi:hypothetical protein
MLRNVLLIFAGMLALATAAFDKQPYDKASFNSTSGLDAVCG